MNCDWRTNGGCKGTNLAWTFSLLWYIFRDTSRNFQWGSHTLFKKKSCSAWVPTHNQVPCLCKNKMGTPCKSTCVTVSCISALASFSVWSTFPPAEDFFFLNGHEEWKIKMHVWWYFGIIYHLYFHFDIQDMMEIHLQSIRHNQSLSFSFLFACWEILPLWKCRRAMAGWWLFTKKHEQLLIVNGLNFVRDLISGGEQICEIKLLWI